MRFAESPPHSNRGPRPESGHSLFVIDYLAHPLLQRREQRKWSPLCDGCVTNSLGSWPAGKPANIHSLMPDIIERLERRIRRHVLAAMPKEATFLEDLDLGRLLIEYRIWRGQFILPQRRAVFESKEMRESDKRRENQAVIECLASKLAAGESINAFLSSSVQRIPRPRQGKVVPRDQLLAEWGIHHLHLSDQIDGDGFVKRTDDVLFAIFKDDAAYLIGIYGHPGTDNWARQDIFATLVRNWPDRGLVAELKGVIGLSQQYDDDDRAKLRKAGLSGPVEVDGKVYSPGASLGQTTAGTPIEATMGMQRLMWALREWEKDFSGKLRSVGANPYSYWLPKIETPVPGFEEHAGFSHAGAFVGVGRVI